MLQCYFKTINWNRLIQEPYNYYGGFMYFGRQVHALGILLCLLIPVWTVHVL